MRQRNQRNPRTDRLGCELTHETTSWMARKENLSNRQVLVDASQKRSQSRKMCSRFMKMQRSGGRDHYYSGEPNGSGYHVGGRSVSMVIGTVAKRETPLFRVPFPASRLLCRMGFPGYTSEIAGVPGSRLPHDNLMRPLPCVGAEARSPAGSPNPGLSNG